MEEFISNIKATHRIRDPLYGFIHLTDAELDIIDTPIFQRLRRIHQLSLTKYVYPSAEHSRFTHSIGVMHCATLLLSGVFCHKLSNLSWKPSEKIIKALRFAALLHDIGHLPFSHAAEKQWLNGLKHEDLSQYIIEKYKPISDIIAASGVKPQNVASLLAKKPLAKERLLHEIISGQLDADRADYLLRDSHCCGVRYGEYDFARFLQIFAADEAGEHGDLFLILNESDLHVAESLLIARYHYNLQIPYHRTRSGYDFALQCFIRDMQKSSSPFTITENCLTNVDLDLFSDLDDYRIIEQAKKERRNNKWADYILRSKHLIALVDTSSMSPRGVRIFKELAKLLKDDAELVEDNDFFIQDRDVEILKWSLPADGVDPSPSRSSTIVLSSTEGKDRQVEHVDICERSWIFRHLTQEPYRVCRIYVTPEAEEKVRRILSMITI